MSVETGNGAGNVSGTKIIDSRCIVEFRPGDNWNGDYGFDWLRCADTIEAIHGQNVKSSYSSIVGKYAPYDPDYSDTGHLEKTKNGINYYDLLCKEYTRFRISGLNRHYYVPMMSLYYLSIQKGRKILPTRMLRSHSTGKEIVTHLRDEFIASTRATIKVLINATSIKKIVFKCDDCLSIEPNVIPIASDGKIEKAVTVKIQYAFEDAHKSIKVFAHHKDGKTTTFAGQLNVVKCEPKTVNICIVNVKVKNGNTIVCGIPNNNFFNAEKKELTQCFNQAQLIPNITIKDLDFDENSMSAYWLNHENSKVILLDPEGYPTIGKALEQHFNTTYSSSADCFKVFYLGIRGFTMIDGQYAGVGGAGNDIPSTGLVIFEGHREFTVCHELLHCFGLYHSFSNKSKHTFEKRKTNNIMDYTRNHFSMWRWQWNLISQANGVNKLRLSSISGPSRTTIK